MDEMVNNAIRPPGDTDKMRQQHLGEKPEVKVHAWTRPPHTPHENNSQQNTRTDTQANAFWCQSTPLHQGKHGVDLKTGPQNPARTVAFTMPQTGKAGKQNRQSRQQRGPEQARQHTETRYKRVQGPKRT